MFVPIVIVILHSDVYLRSSTLSHKICAEKCVGSVQIGENCAFSHKQREFRVAVFLRKVACGPEKSEKVVIGPKTV